MHEFEKMRSKHFCYKFPPTSHHSFWT